MIINNDINCTGCRTCENICPENCISLIENNEGFLYPYINSKKCIKCNKCSKYCPIDHEFKFKDEVKQKYYLAYNKNDNELLNSSSGGVFYVIAKNIIKNNGVVFGATIDNKMQVFHCDIQNYDDLRKLSGSKYVQSNVNNTYKKVQEYLLTGKYVLYTGTPCQIAGLKMYLNKDYSNLYTIDILCHGAPSQKMFTSHIKWLEGRYNKKIEYYQFRNKNISKWGDYHYCYKFTDSNKIYSDFALFDIFFKSFIKGQIFRDSCYSCKYASLRREGDFTIGDFWGVEEYYTDIDTNNGISILMINTNKASNLFEDISDDLIYRKTKIEWVMKNNHSLSHPVSKPMERKKIFNYISANGYEKWASNYYHSKEYIIRKVSSKIPRNFKILINKILK